MKKTAREHVEDTLGRAVQVQAQGKAIVERNEDGLLVMLPTGRIYHASTKDEATRIIQRYVKRTLKGDVGVLTIEWR
jgi:hypothetical protein